MLAGAPAALALAGGAAEWLDFRALRYPILLVMLAGVVLTARALETSAQGDLVRRQAVVRTVAIGVGAWAAAESLYVVIHALRGQPFDAERFGPQWAQALGLIAVHALVLGAPTGVAAAAVLRLRSWWAARA
jgi:hypothetical protein